MVIKKTESIAVLQLLRAIAALLVVAWHMFQTPPFAPGSKLGVQVFFMISGFIMTYTTHGDKGTLAGSFDFLLRRIIRIYPLWLLALAMTLALRPEVMRGEVFWPWLFSSIALSPVNLGPAGPPSAGEPILNVGWTLNYEMYFYMFFSVTMLFGRFRWVALAIWVGFTLVALPSFAAGNRSFYISLMSNRDLIVYFIAGIAIALVRDQATIRSTGILTVFLIVSSIGVAYMYLNYFTIAASDAAWLPWLTFFFLALMLFDKVKGIRVPAWIQRIGDASFSIYLLHPLILPLLSSRGRFAEAMALCAVVLISMASHRFYEAPTQRWLSSIAIKFIPSARTRVFS